MSSLPLLLKSPTATTFQPAAPSSMGWLATPPFDMYQAAVLPAPSFHSTSVVPLPLKSPVAITLQPAADMYMDVLAAVPFDMSQPPTLPSALFFHMTSAEPSLLKSPVATTLQPAPLPADLPTISVLRPFTCASSTEEAGPVPSEFQ